MFFLCGNLAKTYVWYFWKEYKNNLVFFLQNASAQAALQAAQVHALTNNSVTPSGTPTTPLTNGQDIQGGPNTVLRVIVEHMIYPISLDILYLVCFLLYPKWINVQ